MTSNDGHKCLLHPERTATHDPQGLLLCAECDERYQAERTLNLPLSGRPLLQELINVRHNLKGENDDGS